MDYMRGGTLLIVDLSTGKIEKRPSKPLTDKFMGGHGLNVKVLYDLVDPAVKPLEPGNALSFATGPFTGTLCPGSSRVAVAAKSPMTGCLGLSNFGGYWGAELKYAGYDQLVIIGKAEGPVYIEIENEKVVIHSAEHLWGKDNYETTYAVRQELKNPEFQIVSIGPAGENLVHYASIMGRIGNAAGRTGMGAVMGSKNLKAIAVRGTKGVKIANPEGYMNACIATHELIKNSDSYDTLSSVGAALFLDKNKSNGLAPFKNYQLSTISKPSSALEFVKSNLKKRTGCFACPVRCMDVFSIPDIGSGVISCLPYTELTNKILLSDMRSWWKVIVLCQRYGLDTHSLAGVLSWIMECFERGVITVADTDGIVMEWGNIDSILEMAEKIAKREGCGEVFANNLTLATQIVGRDSDQYAMHTKGMPHMCSDLQHFRGRALAGAVETRGDHLHGASFAECIVDVARQEGDKDTENYFLKLSMEMGGTEKAGEPLSYDGRAQMMKEVILTGQSPDILGHCRWHSSTFLWFPVTLEVESRMLSEGLGHTVTPDQIRLYVEKMYTLVRAFNAREGFNRDHDILPSRWFEEPIEGRPAGDVLDRDKFEQMKTDYYQLWGWDDRGIPTEATLENLDLDRQADMQIM